MVYPVIWTQDLYAHLAPAELETLLNAMPDATVFVDWAWLSSCFDHQPAGREPWILLVRDEQQKLLACLPLSLSCVKQWGLSYKVLHWLQFPFGDRMLPLMVGTGAEAQKLRQAILDALVGAPFQWDRMIWNDVPDQHSLLADWQVSARTSRLLLRLEKKSTCPVITLAGRDLATIENSLSKSARQRVKRARKRLMQESGVEILHDRPAGQPDTLLPRLEEIRALENQSWKGGDGVGVFEDASWPFFRTLMLRLAERDQLDLAEIRIGGRLASYRFGMCYRGVFLDYNLAYLPEYHKLGLGRILLDELVTDCAKKGYQALDASRVGRVSQNLLFERADAFVDHWQLRWYGPGFKGRLLCFINEVMVRGAKWGRAHWRAWQQKQAAKKAGAADEGDAG